MDTVVVSLPSSRQGSTMPGSRSGSESDMSQNSNLTPVAPVVLTQRVTYSWSNISAWIGPGDSPTDNTATSGFLCKKKAANKIVLNEVSGILRHGELTCILGASGAGKSTLMDVLTFRNSSQMKVSGQRAINGKVIETNTITSISAYVQQNDLFVGVLTPREHLVFQALVRMDSHLSYEERMIKVEQVIQEFGLSKCANTRIGTKWFKGISGGEMRRLSIASEVLTDPMLMCCDEPTSGLDSASAESVLLILKGLANMGKTVLCSVHQPSSQLYALFDRVMYMTEGRIAYLGPVEDSIEHFGRLGYVCPEHYNPADFIIGTLAITDDESHKRVAGICEAFRETPTAKQRRMSVLDSNIVGDASLAKETSRYKASWGKQFSAVLKRSWTTFIRDPMVLKMRVLQSIILGLFVGTIYFQQDIDTVDGIQNVSGAIFMMICSLTYQNVIGVLDTFCSEVPVFLREHFNGMYRTDVYFISKIIIEIPFCIIMPTVFTGIAYYMIGFDSNIVSFLKTLGIMVLITYICSGLGYLLSCVATSVTVALLLAPIAIFPFFLFGGFLVRPGTGVIFLRWIQHISWFFYGYETMTTIQLEGIEHIHCDRPNNSTCPKNGIAVLESLSFDKDNFTTDVLYLVGIGVGITALCYLALLSRTIRR